MSQDATKVVLAGSQSNHKELDCFADDPADFPAGTCVSLSSTGALSKLSSAGMRIGVSKGASLTEIEKTSVLRRGLRVPVLAALKRSTGLITMTNFTNLAAGDTITVGATGFVGQAGAVTPGGATFQAATSLAATATSLAAQINAHATASTLVYAIASSATVRLYAKVEGAATGHDVAVSYTDASPTSVGATLSELSGGKLAGGSDTITDIDYATTGTKMYINNTTGKADVAMTGFSTVSDAVYVGDDAKTGINESGSEVAAVLVDYQGGL